MACRITALTLDAHDPRALAVFWCEVLGYVITDTGTDESGTPIVSIGAPAGHRDAGRGTIDFVPAGETKRQKLRLHLDVNATDTDQDTELIRLLALGATHADIGQGDEVSWHVLADPEGNEFCLLHSTVDA